MVDLQRKILIVDDDTHILNSLTRLLEEEGYIVFSAISAAEGLALLEKETVTAVISDQKMPEMDGTEFLKIVRKSYPDTARLILSGQVEADAAIDALVEGDALRVLSKPWGDEAFLQAIDDAIVYSLTP